MVLIRVCFSGSALQYQAGLYTAVLHCHEQLIGYVCAGQGDWLSLICTLRTHKFACYALLPVLKGCWYACPDAPHIKLIHSPIHSSHYLPLIFTPPCSGTLQSLRLASLTSCDVMLPIQAIYKADAASMAAELSCRSVLSWLHLHV